MIISENELENEYLLGYYAPKLIWCLKDYDYKRNDFANNDDTNKLDKNESIKEKDLIKIMDNFLRDANTS